MNAYFKELAHMIMSADEFEIATSTLETQVRFDVLVLTLNL